MNHEAALARLSVLAVSLRRRMYEFIRRRNAPVSRDEAAAAVGISRKLAAFHLDKLVDAGFLKARYERLPGRAGPGAGRPSKLYEPDEVELEVSVPPRHYDVPGQILLDALETRGRDEDALAAACRVAYKRGFAAGAKARDEARSPGRGLVGRLLREQGYEPYSDKAVLRLRNCPFHRLAEHSPDTVCAMNQALIGGLLEGAGENTRQAVLDPRPRECCVAIVPLDRSVDRRKEA